MSEKNELLEIKAMLTVIWEKLDNLERSVDGRPNSRAATNLAYFNELKAKAQRVMISMPED